MADTSAVVDRYDIFECGTFWDLALLFGFSNAVDGDSFESTPLPETKRSHTLSHSCHLGSSWSTLSFIEDQLTSSRNEVVLSPISFDRELALGDHSLDNEELFPDQIMPDLSSNEVFHVSEFPSLGGLILESSFSKDQSPDWIVMGSILDDSSRLCSPQPGTMSKSHSKRLHSLKHPFVTSTPDNEKLPLMKKIQLEKVKTALTFTTSMSSTSQFS